MKLYEIAAEMEHALAMADPLTGELPLATTQLLDKLEMDAAAKVEGCCKAVKNLLGHADMMEKEAKQFAARAQACKTQAEQLKQYIRFNLERMGTKKIAGPTLTARLQPGAESLKVKNLSLLQREAATDNGFAIEKVIPSESDPKTFKVKAGGVWDITLHLSSERCKETGAVPEGTAIEKGDSLFIVPSRG